MHMKKVKKNKEQSGFIKSADHCWQALTTKDVLDILQTNQEYGLSLDTVAKRMHLYGSNVFAIHKSQNLLMRFLRQFNNILIYILLLSAVIAASMQRWVDMSVILAVIVLNAIVGFIQEGKAEKALAAIRNMLAPMAKVIREGKKTTILASDLTPGDIVLLESGDKVPADLRLLETRGLQIQEAILTGEAHAVEKITTAVDENAVLAERFDLAYSGTIVTRGSGIGVVIAVGLKTEIGKVSEILSAVEVPTTPLLQQMNRFGYWLTVGILLLGVVTFLIGFWKWQDSIQELLMAIVGLIVAAVPEGLPAILTIILALGVTRMAKRHAIIRRLPAVETMGAVTTICSDKTGTLTCNELIVENIITAKNNYDVTADKVYIVAAGDKKVATEWQQHQDFYTALVAGILCNDAEFNEIDGRIKHYGDPLDQAIIMLAHKTATDVNLLKKEHPRTDLIPYESEHKFMATLHHDHEKGKSFIYVKGAPEQVLSMCKLQQLNGVAEGLNLEYWNKETEKLARNGQKVLAIAFKEVSIDAQTLRFNDVTQLTMVSLFGFIDPPRLEAKDAVAECHAAGIKVKMITGDHALTARAIAEDIGIIDEGILPVEVLSGVDIEAMTDAELAEKVLNVDVYARTTPQHKLRLVKALQANDQVVAMTGDGVNDAPALRQADIGVAMGEKGTEIAKEASEMVLTDDNFATIAHAVEEGRTIYENLKKTILYVLPTSIAQAFVIVVAILLGWQSPITPVQILWVNMVTAITLSLALGFEPPAADVMSRPPRSKNTPVLSMFLAWRVVFVSFLLVLSVFILSLAEKSIGADLATTRTVAVNMIVMGEIVYLFNCRRIYTSAFTKEALFGSKAVLLAIFAVLILQFSFTYVPLMQNFFGTEKIDVVQWLRISGISLGIFILIEIEKLLVRRKGIMRRVATL